MPAPAPRSLPSRAARVLLLGVALGVASSIVATLIGYEIATATQLWRWEPTWGAWVVRRLLVGQLGPLAVAPLFCWLAARAFQGLPSSVAATTVVTVQLGNLLLGAASVGFGALASVEEVALLVLPTLAGAALAHWAMGRAQRPVAPAAPGAPAPGAPAGAAPPPAPPAPPAPSAPPGPPATPAA